MKVTVMNRVSAKRYSYHTHPESSVIISITDPDKESNVFEKSPLNNIKAVLRVQFQDVDAPNPESITNGDASKIAKFAMLWYNKVDVIIVHCEAGQSRSAGAAAAILKYFTGKDDAIFDDYRYTPNRTVYRKVLNNLFDLEEK